MPAPVSPDGEWRDYFEAALTKPLHPLYHELDKHLPPTGHALELGCGVGHGVLHLLAKGFTVTAVDASAEALDILRSRLPEDSLARVELVLANLEQYEPAGCDLSVAGFTLFFLPPAELAAFWARLVAAIRPGGIFMGEFLGPNDDWSAQGYTSHWREKVERMLRDFTVVHFEEVERDGHTVQGTPKHWHVYHVIAVKKS